MTIRGLRRCGFGLLVAMFTATGFIPIKIAAAGDVTPPQISGFSLSTATINTQGGSQTVTATFTLTDSETGTREYGEVDLSSDDGSQMQAAIFHRTSGDEHNGVYAATVTIPQWSKKGIWEVSGMSFFDNIGNGQSLNASNMITLFGAGVVQFTNTAAVDDTTAPTITGFSIAPATINTDSASQVVTATFTITDDLSGVQDSEIILTPPTSTQTGDVIYHRTAGTNLNGTYQAVITLPQGSEGGVWKVATLKLQDNVGNRTIHTKASLEGLFGAGSVQIVNAAVVFDTTPPEIASISITPTEINTENQSQLLTVTVTLTDSSSGVREHPEFLLTPLIGTQMGDVLLDRTAGDQYSGTYTGSIVMPQGAKVGIWQAYSLSFYDNLGNGRFLQTNDLNSVPGAEGLTIVNTAEAQSVTIDKSWTISSATGSVTFPAGTVVTRKEGGNFAFYQMLAVPYEVTARTSNGRRNGVVGTIRTGVPGLDLSFSQPVTVSLVVDSSLNHKRLRIQSLDENGTRWADESQCLVNDNLCTFTVTHATYFLATTDITGLLPDTLPITGAHAY